jgi:hypothetical protein
MHMRWRWLVSLFALPLALAACGDEDLDSALGKITVAPLEADFGPVWIGERLEVELTLANDGRVPVTLAAANLGEPFDGPSTVTVPAAGETKIKVGFKPVAEGVAEREVTLSSDAGPSVVLPVRGVGVLANLDVAETLDFGAVRVGAKADLPLVVGNEAPLGITDFRFEVSGEDAHAFSVARAIKQVPAKATAELGIEFKPTLAAPQAAVLSVSACARCEATKIVLRGRGIDIDLVATPGALDFGPVPPDKTRTLALEVRNRGEAVASLREARVEGEGFSVAPGAVPANLGQGDAVNLEVTFAPRDVGDRQGLLSFIDETGEVALQVGLRGHGGGPVLVATPAAVDFGRRAVGWTGAMDITVTNVGEDVPVEVLAATVEGDPAWTVTAPALPAPVGEEGLVFRVEFTATSLGDSAANLVLANTNTGLPEVRVPLAARVVEQPGCEIVARPAEVRFGLVIPGRIYQRTVELRNAGTESCIVWGVGLDPEGSESFLLLQTPEDRELGPTEAMEVTVSFSPLSNNPAVLTSALKYRTSNPEAAEGEVPVSGYAPGIIVDAVPNPLDFGVVPLNRAPRMPVSIRGNGYPPPRILGTRFSPDSDLSFSLVTWPSFPAAVTTAGVDLVLDFLPQVAGKHAGYLEVQVENALEPLIVRLLGEGDDGPCGEECEPPVPTCPAPAEGLVNQQTTLVGSAIDPNGDEVSCEWAVARRPSGSSAQPAQPTSCTTDFIPDLVGDYVLRFRVRDPLGNIGECTTLYTARAPTTGLWVEMFWDVNNDVDLHLLHGSFTGDPLLASSWQNHNLVCYYGNCKQDPATGLPVLPWDLPGTADDPSLDRDDTRTIGPENIRIDAPTANLDYHVGINFYAMNGGPTHVTTNVYCGGQLAGTEHTNLTFNKERIFLGTLRFDAAGLCTWDYVGLAVLPDTP